MKLYTPRMIESMSEKEMRKAYSELRKIANKRLARMEAADLGRYGSYRFGKLENIWSGDLPHELAEVSKYLREPYHTVRSERKHIKEVLTMLHKKGYNEITRENIYDFFDFIDDVKEKYGESLYDSNTVFEIYDQAQRLNIDRKTLVYHYADYKTNMKRIEKLNPKPKGGVMRYRDLKEAIGGSWEEFIAKEK